MERFKLILNGFLGLLIILFSHSSVFANSTEVPSEALVSVGFDKDIDAMFSRGEDIYIFKKDQYIRCNRTSGDIDFGYPRSIASNWKGIFASDIDAVIYRKEIVYFFKGDEYVRFDWELDRASNGYPKKIASQWPGLYASDIDAAFMKNDEICYFFKEDGYMRFDWSDNKVNDGYPKNTQAQWNGVNCSSVDAVYFDAKKSSEGVAYLFTGSDYLRFDWNDDKVDSGYPKKISAGWNTKVWDVTIDENRWYEIQTKKSSEKVLDSGGQELYIYNRNNTDAQRFRFEKVSGSNGGNLYYIRAQRKFVDYPLPKEKSIDVYAYGKNNGDKVVMYLANQQTNQQFRVKDEGDGYVSFSPYHASEDNFLDLYAGETDNGSHIKLYDDSGASQHRMFKLNPKDVYSSGAVPEAPKTLFIYFNGTDKSLEGQLTEFGSRINADLQIYVKGVGANWDNLDEYSSSQGGSHIETVAVWRRFSHWNRDGQNDGFLYSALTYLPFGGTVTDMVRKGEYKSQIVTMQRHPTTYSRRGDDDYIERSKIYAMNKDYYGGTDDGYRLRDSEMVAKDVLKLLRDLMFDDIRSFDKIVISGHSRGAAAGIPSFLYGIKKAEEGAAGFFQYQDIVRRVFGDAKEINIVALDPVAGQPGNTYHMGNWDTGEIYRFLDSKYNVTFTEVYANAARMTDALGTSIGGVRQVGALGFNPAKKYLCNPGDGINVNRYWLGFRHSSMINLNEPYYKFYDAANEDKPSLVMSDFLNAAINDQDDFSDYSKWRERFRLNDQKALDAMTKSINEGGVDELGALQYYVNKRHSSFTNNTGHNVNLEDLIGNKGAF